MHWQNIKKIIVMCRVEHWYVSISEGIVINYSNKCAAKNVSLVKNIVVVKPREGQT